MTYNGVVDALRLAGERGHLGGKSADAGGQLLVMPGLPGVEPADPFGVCGELDQRGGQALACRIAGAHEGSAFQG